ncbi:MAG: chromosomal replication initiator protein DnaA [Planctomycetota bacterium]
MPLFDPAQWQRLLDVLRQRHATITRQWFHDELKPGVLNNGLLEVHTNTAVQQKYLQKQCVEPFTDAAQEVTGQLIAVRFVCTTAGPAATPPAGPTAADPAAAETKPPAPAAQHTADEPAPPAPNGQPAPAFDLDRDSMLLVPDYAFPNFITGPNNQLAYAAAVAVANQPGTAYNPLFIHGGVGLGKTHLLQSICQSILTHQPQTRILYVSCETFMNQFIACVSAGQMNEFRYHYRHVDLLVIDDIHFLANRERSQEEFFHTFNELYQSNRQIVLSSDAPPDEIPNLEDRLVSRFQWGLVTTVRKPSYETRVAIVKAKAKMRGLDLPEDVVELIARTRESNARELEGAIKKLQAQTMIDEGPIDLDLARRALGEPDPVPQANRTTLQHVVEAVTRFYNVKLADLQSRRRFKSITEPRQVCMFLVKERTKFSLTEIGGYFGGRDHTTVIHSIEVVRNRLEQEPGFPRQLEHLNQDIDRAAGQIV